MTNRSLLRVLERERAHHDAQITKLIDTICHLAGRPWQVPPYDLQELPAEPDETDNGRYVLTPESLPDDL